MARRPGAALSLIGAALVSLPAFAGEPPQVLAKPAAAPEAEAPKRVFREWNPEGRRDPFEFRSQETVEERPEPARRPEPAAPPELPQPDRRPSQPGETSLRQARQFVETKAADAEAYLAVQSFDKVLEACTEGLNKVKDAQIADQALVERLERLRATAQRLKARLEIEEEFRKLGIEIQGVVWEPGNPLALIKGRSVRRGDTVENALVEQIGPAEVIFLYKGVRCRKSIGR